MKILLLGANGQLGWELQRSLAPLGQMKVCDRHILDIGNFESLRTCTREYRPEIIVNAAAYTDVDKAESESDKACRINTDAVAVLAEEAKELNAYLIHFSTDYVFSGEGSTPYTEEDSTEPKTVYGQSKLAGEAAIAKVAPNHLIARISWLYGPGGPSFVHTMMRLGAQEGEALKVVDDQVGGPTSTLVIADALRELLKTDAKGLLHLTCAGEASWFELARATFELQGLEREVIACTSAEYPRPAPRPHNSRLDGKRLNALGIGPMPHWRDALASFLRAYPDG